MPTISRTFRVCCGFGSPVRKYLSRQAKPLICATVCVLATLLCLVGSAYGQSSTASIAGTVHDPSSAVVLGAEITATETETGASHHATSNEDGSYVFPSLPVGPYSLEVRATGFATYKQTGIVLTVNQAANILVTLTLGSTTESVNVTANVVNMDTTAPVIQTIVDSHEVADLPLNGRNPATLLLTVAGTSNPVLDPGASANISQGNHPSETLSVIHGVRSGDVYYSLDGATNTDPFQVSGGPFPNPEATQEFNVVTGTYGSKYVSAAGGAVNIVIKSGTNQLHGSVFDYERNGAFNAEQQFAPFADPLKRHQYGFAVGAPIKHDKWFIFGAYQETRIFTGSNSIAFVPTSAERAGNFSALLPGIQLTNPYTLAPIPNNNIAALGLNPMTGGNLFSHVQQQLLAFIPQPTQDNPLAASDSLPFARPSRTEDAQFVAKTDYILGNHRFFARYFRDKFNADRIENPTDLLANSAGSWDNWDTGAFGDSWTNGKNLFNDFRFSILETESYSNPPPTSPNLVALGAQMTQAVAPGIFMEQASGAFNISGGSVNDWPRRTIAFDDGVTLIRGKHEVSFGAQIQKINNSIYADSGQNPLAIYSGFLGSTSTSPLGRGNAIADFEMGTPIRFLQSDGIFSHPNDVLYGFYGQDKINVAHRLTVTVGLRWDPYWPYHDRDGFVTCWAPGQKSTKYTNAPLNLIVAGDPGCNSTGTGTTLAAFGPTFGLAYQVDSAAKTVVRVGYGRYYEQYPAHSFLDFAASQPFIRTVSAGFNQGNKFIDAPYATFPGGNPFVGGFLLNSNPRPSSYVFTALPVDNAISPGFGLTDVEQWSLSIQHEFRPSDTLQVAYIGDKGTHESLQYALNTPIFGPGATVLNEPAREPWPAFGKVSQINSNGNSIYHGLEVTYRHSFQGGLTATSTFAYSRSIDDGSIPGSALLGTPYPVVNHNFRRSVSDFDQPLTWRTSAVWNAPALRGENAFVRGAFGSWGLSGIFTWDEGFPFSITDAADNSLTGLGADLADRVPGAPLYVAGQTFIQHAAQAFNTAAFTANAIGTFGNSGRNVLRSPGLVNLDMGLAKTFSITERWKTTFRTDFFNAMNHTNYNPPGNAFGTASFGKFTSSKGQRILQLSLKILF
jgi:hypothetical protein